MRNFSTPESADRGEISLLAIIETVLSIIITIGIAIKYETLLHIFIGSLIAPFLLFRTDYSTKLGFSMFSTIHIEYEILEKLLSVEVVQPTDSDMKFLLSSLYFFTVEVPINLILIFIMLGSTVIIRPLAALVGLFRHPIISFRAVPKNWKRIAGSVDLKYPPEPLPGLETYSTNFEEFRFGNMIGVLTRFFRSPFTFGSVLANGLLFLTVAPILILFYIPTLIYRFSLKSTTILYLPLIWLTHISFSEGNTLIQKLEDIKESPAESHKRIYAYFIIIFLTILPLFIFSSLAELIIWAKQNIHTNADLMRIYIPFNKIELWHIARSLNAVLTVILYYLSYSILRDIESGKSLPGNATDILFRGAFFVRGLFALYTLICGIYIVSQSVSLPAVGSDIFPW